MNKSTNDQTVIPAECPAWCDLQYTTDGVSRPHDGEHDGEADLPPITATGNRNDYLKNDDGILVPEVVARLIQNDDAPDSTLSVPRLRIALSVWCPDESGGTVHLTVDETELLRRHLGQLLRDAGRDVAS